MVPGKCKKYEYECDNGRCIDDSLACGPYKSCGYSVDCHPGVGILRDVCLVVMGGIMFSSIIMAMLCCCRRKQSQNKVTMGRVFLYRVRPGVVVFYFSLYRPSWPIFLKCVFFFSILFLYVFPSLGFKILNFKSYLFIFIFHFWGGQKNIFGV